MNTPTVEEGEVTIGSAMMAGDQRVSYHRAWVRHAAAPGYRCVTPAGPRACVVITGSEAGVRIYVGNLSYSTNEEGLRTKFSEFGEVEEAKVISDYDTGRSRGFGFVTMPNDEEANAAIEALNGTELDGRTLKVNEARPRGERGGGRQRW
jgi:cold-inducible RNA-binding protein